MGISEFAATSASMGSSLRQGGHQVAHRFTTKGRPAKFSGIRGAPLRRASCGKSGSGRGSGRSSAVAVNQTAPKITTVASPLPIAGRGRILQARMAAATASRSEEHTSELQSRMRHSYAVFCLKKKKQQENK